MLASALDYIARGWKVIPIPTRAKSPTLPGWPTLRVTTDTAANYFSGNGNIGVLLGSASGIIDIDFDDPIAVELAPQYLPPTRAVFGRPSKPGSHWIYATDNPRPTRRFQRPQPDGRAIVEYRSNGAQTVFPPSIHPTGEVISWWDEPVPAMVDGQALLDAVERLAEAVKARGKGNLAFDATLVRPAEPVSAVDRCTAYLEKCPDAISGQGGHNATFLAACECFRFGLSHDEAWQVLQWFNQTKCQPAWNDKELRHKLTQAARKVSDEGQTGARLIGDVIEYAGFSHAAPLPADSPLPVEPQPAAPDMPESILSPPGTVGDIVRWLNNTAYKKQPLLSVAAAITFWGALVGRKVKTATDLRTNLYCLGVGETGCGKDHSRKQIKRLCKEAGAFELIGGEDVSSDSAILSAVAAHPSILFQFDEIAHMLKSINSRNAPTNMRSIPPLLMKLFSSASSSYAGKEYANRSDRPRQDIDQPNVCLYGTTTPGVLFDGLTPSDISDGFLGRMLTFISTDPDPMEAVGVDPTYVDENLIDSVATWFKYVPPPPPPSYRSDGTLNTFKQATDEKVAHPIRVLTTTDADHLFAQFLDECRKQRARHLSRSTGLAPLWSRAAEHAYKVSLIIASGCPSNSNGPSPYLIDGVIAQYAIQLVTYLVSTLAVRAEACISTNEHERKHKLILDMITKAGPKGMRRNLITRRTQFIDQAERERILKALVEGGYVNCVNDTDSSRRPAITYICA